ncbi:MAG: hypothetical protein IPJ50_06380 [Betaproteobacteria bacterium]|nr:hypothetical protein [Betaproteobacteria bacterium]
MQNKAGRYYVTETLKLAAGAVYISPMDLNVENGAIEVPHKATLRLATPLADGQGKKRGIIILNYLADEMLGYMEAVTGPVADHLMLLNTAGYFVHAPNPADEWGFMFNDDSRRLSARFPDAWARLANEDHGQFVDAQGLWTFQAVYPLLAGTYSAATLRGSEQKPPSAAEQTRRWRIVTYLSTAQLNQMVRQGEAHVYLWVLLLIGLFAGGAFAIVRASSRERERTARKVFLSRRWSAWRWFRSISSGLRSTRLYAEFWDAQPSSCCIKPGPM